MMADGSGDARGRSPPTSASALARYNRTETHLTRAAARGAIWFKSSACFGSPVNAVNDSSDDELLPPPPPLPTDGTTPMRFFIPQASPLPASASSGEARSGSMMVPSNDAASTEPQTPIHHSTLQLTPELGHATASPEDRTSATPLFVPVQAPLLPEPGSSPPRRPLARRKTLAGVSGFAGFPVQRSSPRLKSKKRNMPIAKLAEQLLCHRLGIVSEGEPITEEAIAKFVQMFNGQLPDIAIAALRALFRMDCDFATAVEDALVAHGGAGRRHGHWERSPGLIWSLCR